MLFFFVSWASLIKFANGSLFPSRGGFVPNPLEGFAFLERVLLAIPSLPGSSCLFDPVCAEVHGSAPERPFLAIEFFPCPL